MVPDKTESHLGTDHLTCRGGMVFCFVQNFFSDNTRVRILIFFVAQSANFFFQNSTLGYMTKTLNQIFFFLHQNQNIFFSNIGNQNFFLENWHHSMSHQCMHLYDFFEPLMDIIFRNRLHVQFKTT